MASKGQGDTAWLFLVRPAPLSLIISNILAFSSCSRCRCFSSFFSLFFFHFSTLVIPVTDRRLSRSCCCTMVQSKQESKNKYRTTRSFLRSLAPLTIALHCLLCSRAHLFTCLFPHSWECGRKVSQNDPVLSNSALIHLKIHSSRGLFIVIYPNIILTTKHGLRLEFAFCLPPLLHFPHAASFS